jgi:hypothetical protein
MNSSDYSALRNREVCLFDFKIGSEFPGFFCLKPFSKEAALIREYFMFKNEAAIYP